MTNPRVTRSSAGGVEALALKTEQELDSSFAGMTSEGTELPAPPQEEWKLWLSDKQELDSRLRGNDEPGSYPLLRRRSGSSGSAELETSKIKMASCAVEERLAEMTSERERNDDRAKRPSAGAEAAAPPSHDRIADQHDVGRALREQADA